MNEYNALGIEREREKERKIDFGESPTPSNWDGIIGC